MKKTKKSTYCLLKKSKYILNHRTLKFQYIFSTFFQSFKNFSNSPADPFEKVSLDTIGKLPTTPNGKRHILTMQDNFGKYCIAVPIPYLKTTTIAHAVATTLASQYGRYIITDRGGSFISKLMKLLERLFNIE